jgi:hypothetical protein
MSSATLPGSAAMNLRCSSTSSRLFALACGPAAQAGRAAARGRLPRSAGLAPPRTAWPCSGHRHAPLALALGLLTALPWLAHLDGAVQVGEGAGHGGHGAAGHARGQALRGGSGEAGCEWRVRWWARRTSSRRGVRVLWRRRAPSLRRSQPAPPAPHLEHLHQLLLLAHQQLASLRAEGRATSLGTSAQLAARPQPQRSVPQTPLGPAAPWPG